MSLQESRPGRAGRPRPPPPAARLYRYTYYKPIFTLDTSFELEFRNIRARGIH